MGRGGGGSAREYKFRKFSFERPKRELEQRLDLTHAFIGGSVGKNRFNTRYTVNSKDSICTGLPVSERKTFA